MTFSRRGITPHLGAPLRGFSATSLFLGSALKIGETAKRSLMGREAASLSLSSITYSTTMPAGAAVPLPKHNQRRPLRGRLKILARGIAARQGRDLQGLGEERSDEQKPGPNRDAPYWPNRPEAVNLAKLQKHNALTISRPGRTQQSCHQPPFEPSARTRDD